MKRLLCTVDERSVQQFYTEMEILANARHDNIVRFLGGCVQPDSLCILLEFCPRSLYDLLRQSKEALPLSQVLRTARQVAGGLYYLHCCTPPVRRLDLRPTSPYPLAASHSALSLPSHYPLTTPSPPPRHTLTRHTLALATPSPHHTLTTPSRCSRRTASPRVAARVPCRSPLRTARRLRAGRLAPGMRASDHPIFLLTTGSSLATTPRAMAILATATLTLVAIWPGAACGLSVECRAA